MTAHAKVAFLLLALAASPSTKGQEPTEPATEKPSPAAKAREMLDAAGEAAGGVRPEIQTAALLHIADNYQLLDKKKAREFAGQAFTAAGSLPQDPVKNRERMQAEVVQVLADIDVPEAVALLRQMQATAGDYDPRWPAIDKIVQVLIQKKDFDAAIELVEGLGSTGFFSYTGARSIFKALPADDPRRTTLFGSAMSAFGVRPHRSFVVFLRECWGDVPKQMAESALNGFLREILDRKSAEEHSQTGVSFATAKGTVSFDSREDSELFDVMHIVRAINPKRAEELLETRPGLRAWLEQYPKGTESLRAEGWFWTFTVMGDDKQAADRMKQQGRAQALTETIASSALNAVREDPDKAISLAQTIPTPARRAEILGSIARSVAGKDPDKARGALDKCITLLDEIKNPNDRVAAWDSVADAAHQINDEKLTSRAIDRALADAAELYKQEEDVEVPNVFLREYWPSTQGYRRAIMRATAILGVDAEPLLLKIVDPELNLFARIAMAQALLGRSQERFPTFAPRKKRR
ncbi:MAG TPA: hypothetical protein VLE22_23870 [Bryobacteraceae bacterium]|nr:hypothetical protein [Bryobacteraceae bacterium]